MSTSARGVKEHVARAVRVYAVQTGTQSPASPPLVSEGRNAGPPRLSIVVLPFANSGGDPEQQILLTASPRA